MKVVKQSNEGWSAQSTCRNCEAVLEVEEKDLTVINTAVDYAGETWEPEIAFECPVCKTEYVNQITKQVPKGIRNRMIDAANDKRR